MSVLMSGHWTSVRNRRYMNVNVHSDLDVHNLGLFRVSGSCPAEKIIKILVEELAVFNLSLDKDIVSITTDGASVMQKVTNNIFTYI